MNDRRKIKLTFSKKVKKIYNCKNFWWNSSTLIPTRCWDINDAIDYQLQKNSIHEILRNPSSDFVLSYSINLKTFF